MMNTSNERNLIDTVSSRLGLKLFVLLTVVITLSIAPLAYISMKEIKGYGEAISSASDMQIRSQALFGLQKITRERAARYQAIFDRIAVSAGLLGAQASALYENQELFAAHPALENDYFRHPDNGFWVNGENNPAVSVYWGGPTLDKQIRQELDALTHMVPLFTEVLEGNPEALASHVITVSGIGNYFTNSEESRTMARNLPPLSVVDLRDGAPVTIFTSSQEPVEGARWTDVYKDDASAGLALTASAPIFDATRTFRGIAGIDVPLNTIIEDVLNMGDIEPEHKILFAFLTDHNGRLIAFPENYFTPFGLVLDTSSFTDSSDSLTFRLSDSSLGEVRTFADIATEGEETFSTLELAEESLLITTSRLPELNWVFGIVVRQADMFALVEQSRATLKETIRTLEVEGALLTVLTVLTALAIVFLSVKYLITPLRTLAGATRRVAEGDLTVRCPVTTRDETGILAESFNQMVDRLRDAQERQQQYASSLEHEVAQRNRELTEKKEELEKTIDLLNQEVERRQIVGEALRASQQQYYDTLEANKAGVFIITENRFSYVNKALADLMHATQQEIIGLSPIDYIGDEDKALVTANMQRRHQGEEIPPYRVKCRRVDGTTYYGEVWAKLTKWQNRMALVGTITDVSNLKENEERLEQQDIQLRKSLEEKEILLKEIYHRTKNNMLVIISMLELQKQDIEDERILTVFQDTENRIRAMALVHEKLYQSGDLSEIDLGLYLQEVVQSLVSNMVLEKRLSLDFEIEPVLITIDYAIPLGLVINELVTNAIKHGFPAEKSGTISLSLKQNRQRKIILEFGDDGTGLPDSIDIQKSKSFGMQLITSLVSMQLRGELKVTRENGTWYLIIFDQPVKVTRL